MWRNPRSKPGPGPNIAWKSSPQGRPKTERAHEERLEHKPMPKPPKGRRMRTRACMHRMAPCRISIARLVTWPPPTPPPPYYCHGHWGLVARAPSPPGKDPPQTPHIRLFLLLRESGGAHKECKPTRQRDAQMAALRRAQASLALDASHTKHASGRLPKRDAWHQSPWPPPPRINRRSQHASRTTKAAGNEQGSADWPAHQRESQGFDDNALRI